MQKILLFNLDFIKRNQDYDTDIYNQFINMLKLLIKQKNHICFYTRDVRTLNSYKDYINGISCHYKSRREVEQLLKDNNDKSNVFIVIGRKDVDFLMAVNNKILFITPTWLPMEDKAKRYGILVDTPIQLFQFIQTINNQNTWYSYLELDNKTIIYSLMDARYGYYANSYKEKDLIKNFEELLKKGKSRNYYTILLYHFLAAMTNTKLFDDIEIWGIIPSSNKDLNQDMLMFKDIVRCIKKGRQPGNYPNILKRHTCKLEAKNKNSQIRKEMGPFEEFETLKINQEYKQKIERLKHKNKFNVCIFDDYMTHGNSFEAARNLFESLGAQKLIFVSLGRFENEYQKNDCLIEGDVYTSNYKARVINHVTISKGCFKINVEAKREVERLYDIFNN